MNEGQRSGGAALMRAARVLGVTAALGALDACGEVGPSCTPGEVQFCPCETSLAGVRQCAPNGMAWSRCACGTLNAFTCGDGRCEVADRFDCPQDCPVRCGDGVCAPAETPASCSQDCTRTPACARDRDCPSGYHCGERACDQARGCFPDDASQGFEIVGDLRRPARCDWEPCTPGADQCGPLAQCAAPPGGDAPMCSHRCDVDDDCPPVAHVPALPVCNTVTHRCVLLCSPTRRCPVEYACESVADDVSVCR